MLGLGLPAFGGFGSDVLRKVTLYIAHVVHVNAVWRPIKGQQNCPISRFLLVEPEVVRVLATGAHKREVLRLVESVVREVVRKTQLLCDSVEFVNHLTLELINPTVQPMTTDLIANHLDLPL